LKEKLEEQRNKVVVEYDPGTELEQKKELREEIQCLKQQAEGVLEKIRQMTGLVPDEDNVIPDEDIVRAECCMGMVMVLVGQLDARCWLR
jgi:hypothetical protein